MIGIMNWILVAIFILATFGTKTDKKTGIFCCRCCLKSKKMESFGRIAKWNCWNCKVLNKPSLEECQRCKQPKFIRVKNTNDSMEIYGKWTIELSSAALNGDEERMQSLLNAFPEEENENLIEFLMKQNSENYRPLSIATFHGHEEIVKALLNVFSKDKNNKLIEYIMKKDQNGWTPLLNASCKGHDKIVKLLLDAFPQEQNENLIKYVMMAQNDDKYTSLHLASFWGHEKVVTLLLNTFGKEKNKQLIEYLMQESQYKKIALHHAVEALHLREGCKKVVQLLCQKQNNAINQMLLCDLQKVSQMFNEQNADQKDNSLLWYLFEDNHCGPGKEIILKFLIIDYSREIHII